MAIYSSNNGQPEERAKLNLTNEEEESLRTVYRKNKEGEFCFLGMYDPEADYTEDYCIVPIKSSFEDFEMLYKGTNFTKVCGAFSKTAEKAWKKLYESYLHEKERKYRDVEGTFHYAEIGDSIYIIPIRTAHNTCLEENTYAIKLKRVIGG